MRSGGSGGGGGGKLVSWLWRAPRRRCRARTSTCGASPAAPATSRRTPPSATATRRSPPRRRRPCRGTAASPPPLLRRRRGDDDMRELVRAASQRLAAERAAAAAEPATVPRSQSVAMARIDEDRPCEFAGVGLVFPRSQSCAVGAGRVGGRRGRVAAVA